MTLELVEEMLASCRRGDRLRLRFLLSLDPTLVIGSSMDGTTCLHVACSAGDEATIDILLDKGANVHARTVDGSTPLCEAAAGGWANVITKLIDRGATVNPPCQLVSALHEAAQNGRTECCRLLVNFGANLDKSDCWYGTPLHAAVHGGHVRTAKVLLDAGANVNATKIHSTPLHYACERGDFPMITLLLLFGADVHCLNNNEQRPSALLPEDHPAKEILSRFGTQPRSLAFWCRAAVLGKASFQSDTLRCKETLDVCVRKLNYPRLLIRFLMHEDTEELIEELLRA